MLLVRSAMPERLPLFLAVPVELRWRRPQKSRATVRNSGFYRLLVVLPLLICGQRQAIADPVNVVAPRGGSLTGVMTLDISADATQSDESDNPAIDKRCLEIAIQQQRQQTSRRVEITWQLDELLLYWPRLPWPRIPAVIHVRCSELAGIWEFGGPAGFVGGPSPLGGGGLEPRREPTSFTLPFFADGNDALVGDDMLPSLGRSDLLVPPPGLPAVFGGNPPFSNGSDENEHADDDLNGDDLVAPPVITSTAPELTPVPEPATLWLTAAGLAAAWRARRRKNGGAPSRT